MSGQVCNDVQQCQAGCRGSGGNGCVAGEVCSSTTALIGTCGPAGADAGVDAGPDASTDAGPTGGPDASTSGGPDAAIGCTNPPCTTAAPDDGILEGGGFGCAIGPQSSRHDGGARGLGVLLFGALGGVLLRRRVRRIAGEQK